jgi:hypothetical protein
MIINWIKTKIDTDRQEKEQRRLAAIQEEKKELDKWREKYFQDISFPIVIFSKKSYLAVATLEEYYCDIDIKIYFVKSDHELVDSNGQKYNFKQTEKEQWVSDKKTGAMSYDEFKKRLTPLLYMPKHKKEIVMTNNMQETMALVSAK